ncbi:MAG TPA: Asp-tRNA(Asn)/Glu-tRNA(Gln) amidotransferase subunit GatC [Terriglobales bacterium]|nr:Asp-tRNA(Asn)/Glu-tRNA(Gln) amidotransferase subunit GatC [Terriglobales bacterium]
MKVTEKDVAYVAELANLELTPEEQQRMLRDMNAILGHIDKLNELDTSGVEPMAQVHTDSHEAMRDDVVRPSLDRDVVMKGAPKTDGSFFKVPKVIEK